MRLIRKTDKSLETIEDIKSLILAKTKEYGSKNEYLSSEEYKAIYPQIEAIYNKQKSNTNEAKMKDLEKAGLKVGDKVKTVITQGFGAGTSVTGKIVLMQGYPYVDMDGKQMTSSGYKKKVPWSKNWRKT